jgi:hypothetical protein
MGNQGREWEAPNPELAQLYNLVRSFVVMTLLEEFAKRYGLKCMEEKALFSDEPSLSIAGRNGYVIQHPKMQNELDAGIIYLSFWERAKKEFRLSCDHCQILPPDGVLDSDSNSIKVRFNPAKENQARVIIDLAQLK